MSNALTYSVAGMQAASDRLSIRARNVANVQTPGFKADEVVQTATGSGPVVSVRPSERSSGAPVTDDVTISDAQSAPPANPDQYYLPFDDMPEEPSDVALEYELTDMIMAEHAYKASAAVTRTVAQLNDTLFDIFV